VTSGTCFLQRLIIFICRLIDAIDAEEKERDHVMLSDVFPTGWHSTRLASLLPGDSVVIYGSGPVGLMAALSARIQGASEILVVDHNTDPPKVAKKRRGQTADASASDISAIRPKGRKFPIWS
jgi:glutathione-independent formaldehyde dehydrogenase